MLAAVGDLVEDIVVQLHGPVNLASDTASVIVRRRGGSAANVCAAAAAIGAPSRFIGQVGEDAAGRMLTSLLASAGVDLAVRAEGRTGTIVVLVDGAGERTMFPDPAASRQLRDPEPAWLDGVHTLHVPVYSLVDEPLATSAMQLAAWAAQRAITVSVDASSVGVLEAFGVDAMVARLAALAPDVLFANADEAACLTDTGIDRIGAPWVVIKHGGDPAVVRAGGTTTAVAAHRLDATVDTTGAGDAFAAGFLVARAAGHDPAACTRAAHHTAATILASPRR